MAPAPPLSALVRFHLKVLQWGGEKGGEIGRRHDSSIYCRSRNFTVKIISQSRQTVKIQREIKSSAVMINE